MAEVLASLRRLVLLLFAAAALSLSATPALPDDASDQALDLLFAQLKDAPNAQTAHEIDQRIWSIWINPTDEALRLRMLDVIEARTYRGAQATLKLLDQLVEDYPDYAEGWNQRATMYYVLGNFEASLADIDKVLELEPRHFGALSGRVLIYLAEGKRALALKDMVTALAIHPFLNEKQLFPELKQDAVHI